MARMTKADEAALAEFGFDFSEPPAVKHTRRGKHHDRWEAARALCERFPGQALKVIEYDKNSTAYTAARAVNNGDNKVFAKDYSDWKAAAGPIEYEDGSVSYGIWLTYTPTNED